MKGRVYIFNATPNDIEIHINENLVGRLVGVSADRNYIPSQLSVERSKDGSCDRAAFAATSKVDIRHADGWSSYTVTIDPQEFPHSQDVQLYLFEHSARLAAHTEPLLSGVVPQPVGEH